MKNFAKLTLITAFAAFFAVAGCETSGRLAKKIDGDWSGTPVKFNKKMPVNGEFTPVFSFTKTSGAGGDVTLSAQMAVMIPVNAPIDSLGTTAVSATASGVATVRGTWLADDGDDIDLAWDLSTLVVNMDPDVEFELANVWTSTDVPTTRTVSDAVKKNFVRQMTDGMTAALKEIDDIDDIKFVESDTRLNCKFADMRQTLRRVFE